jgi:hypothetical protein
MISLIKIAVAELSAESADDMTALRSVTAVVNHLSRKKSVPLQARQFVAPGVWSA